MKKIICGLAILGASALFGADIKGIIQNIDQGKKTIVVNGTTIGVLPYTKIELDSDCGGWDVPKRFSDLKKGDFVSVDLTYNGNMPVAEDIEIKCANRAY